MDDFINALSEWLIQMPISHGPILGVHITMVKYFKEEY